jgi:hypothetical protein
MWQQIFTNSKNYTYALIRAYEPLGYLINSCAKWTVQFKNKTQMAMIGVCVKDTWGMVQDSINQHEVSPIA